MLLVIDNYDSFTYNLVQYLGEMQVRPCGFAAMTSHASSRSAQLKPDRILISPGPCSPRESGLSNDIIRTFGADNSDCSGSAWGTSASGTSSAGRSS